MLSQDRDEAKDRARPGDRVKIIRIGVRKIYFFVLGLGTGLGIFGLGLGIGIGVFFNANVGFRVRTLYSIGIG